MVAVAASPEAEVGDGQEAETEEDKRLRLVQEALHSVPSTHSQRRGEKRRERKEAATMLKAIDKVANEKAAFVKEWEELNAAETAASE